MAPPTPKAPASNPSAALKAPPRTRPATVRIEDVFPVVDCGRHPVKRTSGDTVRASATIFRDGHHRLQAVIRHRAPGGGRWLQTPMVRVDAHLEGDRWSGEFTVDRLGLWSWQVLAWTDRFATWQEELSRRVSGGQREFGPDLAEGASLLIESARRARGSERRAINAALSLISDEDAALQERLRAALDPDLASACARVADRGIYARSDTFAVEVEVPLARFGSWYELFPRSWGGLEGVRSQLPRFAQLGFDVLYLPPIHPIGRARRRGPNDSGEAGPGDPGSPWAIGASEGGHTAVHPDLGTLEQFDRLLADARGLGIEIAMDFAVQCSADHPWLSEHPQWFRARPDGTLKHAENPPKRYLDIYNLDFECADWRSLWIALRETMLFWVEHGVRAFRVDNPHTKPIAFWEWLIASVRTVAPETVLLSEAFTHEAMMGALAKAGFSQSYTYFTWKNSSWELRDYIEQLARPPRSEFLRPNLFANTPDILSEYLQHGGPGAFAARLLLASTLSPSYGIYSGFENFESTPRSEGSEEYLDSEKYQLRERSLDGPLLALVGRLNTVRREHGALQRFENIAFLPVENDALIAYVKRTDGDTVIVVANVDPRRAQEGIVHVPGELGLGAAFEVQDLLGGERYRWREGGNYVRLDPAERCGHLFSVGDPA